MTGYLQQPPTADGRRYSAVPRREARKGVFRSRSERRGSLARCGRRRAAVARGSSALNCETGQSLSFKAGTPERWQ